MRIITFFLSLFMLFTMSSIAQTTLPFMEDFEGSPVDSGWTTSQAFGSVGWTFGANQFSTFWYPQPELPSLGAYAVANDEVCQCDMSADFLVSPNLDLTLNTYVGVLQISAGQRDV